MKNAKESKNVEFFWKEPLPNPGYLEGQSLSFTNGRKLTLYFIVLILYTFFNFRFQGGLTYCTMSLWNRLCRRHFPKKLTLSH